MNICILKGNLSRDVDLQFAKSGTAVAKFGIAVAKFKKEDGANFLNCVAFGKTAEIIAERLSKGSPILIHGEIETGKYENKKGDTVYTTEIKVMKFEFCGGNNQQVSQPTDYLPNEPDITPVDDGDMPF